MNSFKPQEYGESYGRNDKAGQLTRPSLQNPEQSPLRQSPASSFGPTHGTSLLGTPNSNAHPLYFSSQIIRPRVEQGNNNHNHSNNNSISAHNSFAMSTPLSMSMSTAPKQQWHEVSVSHPSHYAGASFAQPQCRPYAVHHDRHPSQRRRIAGYRQGPFPSPQPVPRPLYAGNANTNIHDEHKGAFASRGRGCTGAGTGTTSYNKKVDDSDKEVEQIMSTEVPWNHHQSPHEYVPAQLPAPCHLPQPQPHHPYHYDQYQHQHHYPIHYSNFYASHPYSSYYHPNAQQQQHPRYHPTPSPHPHSHPHSHMRRKRKYRHSRKEFIINVDRSLSPALSDITASPTPSMDEFDDHYEDNNNNNDVAAEKEIYTKSFKSMLQPLLECHKTTDVTVTVPLPQLRIDTSSPSDNLNLNVNANMDPPRIERKSSSSSKKQTTFDWNIIDVDNDNVVRTVSPIKSSPKKENIITRRDKSMSQSKSNSNHRSERKKVWRQLKPQDDASQRFLIANNISQSSSSQWDGA